MFCEKHAKQLSFDRNWKTNDPAVLAGFFNGWDDSRGEGGEETPIQWRCRCVDLGSGSHHAMITDGIKDGILTAQMGGLENHFIQFVRASKNCIR